MNLAGYFPYIFVAVGALAALSFLEFALVASWNRKAWGFGLPIFRETKRVVFRSPVPSEEQLTDSTVKSLLPDLKFKHIGGNEFLFREQMFSFSLFRTGSICRGLLNFDEARSLVDVRLVLSGTQVLSWILALGVFLFFASSGIFAAFEGVGGYFPLIFLGIAFLGGLFLYWLLHRRYAGVADAAARLVARQDV